MNTPFIQRDFRIPEGLENEFFKIRMLTVNDLIKDYEAVMSSVDHLKGVFGLESNWPPIDLSLEQDLIDLGWHQKEFQRRSSFAYTVMKPDESSCLGCVYIYPSAKKGYDAEVFLWVRKSAFENGLDPVLYNLVRNWIQMEWPFTSVGFPGREISWKKWTSLTNK